MKEDARREALSTSEVSTLTSESKQDYNNDYFFYSLYSPSLLFLRRFSYFLTFQTKKSPEGRDFILFGLLARLFFSPNQNFKPQRNSLFSDPND